jgi:hypothetical protein
MATTEPTINDALAEVLRSTRRAWQQLNVIRSENTDVLKETGKKPDILVNEYNVSPVIIETEITPAISVEADAVERLGKKLFPSGKTILSVVALKLPAKFKDFQGEVLKKAISSATNFGMALYSGESSNNYVRFPSGGWLEGNITDLSILVQSASIPQSVVDEAANKLVSGVTEAAAILNEMTTTHPGALQKICSELRQQEGEQTLRMATTILANALIFHESLSRGNGDLGQVRTLDEFRVGKGGINKTAVLTDWQIILGVNYWPIFDIARRILEVIPANVAKTLLERLIDTASDLVSNNLMRSHDLTGAVFQRLIADRKFLAAFYTHPASAALLVGLAIDSKKTPAGGKWGKETDITNLRIADFACGTGTLLSTAYHRIGQLHEAEGGDSEIIHPEMMANSLVGCDVLPAAAHLTASMLAGAHPTIKYEHSSVMSVAYGPREGGGVALGSLDLLDPQRPFDIIAITAKALGGKGEKEKEIWTALPHMSFDLVLMNPPFTKDTSNEGVKIGVTNPTFAAFNSSEEEQREMAKASKRLLQGTSAHGNAGEASAFLVLADRKLKDNGTLAMVMPLSLMSGESWEASRQYLYKFYSDLILISIAGAKDDELSFSADTGMGECLIIGHKTKSENKRATFVVLYKKPTSPQIGSNAAEQIQRIRNSKPRKLEDGPVGGTSLTFGDDQIGYVIDAEIPEKGPWCLSRIRDAELAQVAYQMIKGSRVWFPSVAEEKSTPISISSISEIGTVGPVHWDINGDSASGGIRGPFKVESLKVKSAPTYPILWSHNAAKERCMQFEADSEGILRQGKDAAEDKFAQEKANRIWSISSHCHFNRDFRFNSQSTAIQFTEKKTIGGRAWPSIKLSSVELEKALTLWANSSLGILLQWWYANKQQAGRGSIGVSALESLPVLDVTKLSPESLTKAVVIFDEMKHQELLPINEIAIDKVRHELDKRICTEVLRFPAEMLLPDGPMDLLRRKLALEPSITGSKPVKI